MSQRRLDIDIQPNGRKSRVCLDGEDVPGVYECVVTMRVDGVTRIDIRCYHKDGPIRRSFLVNEVLEDDADAVPDEYLVGVVSST